VGARGLHIGNGEGDRTSGTIASPLSQQQITGGLCLGRSEVSQSDVGRPGRVAPAVSQIRSR